jgi:cysteine desulfurase
MKLPDGTLYFDSNATTPETPEVSAAVAAACKEAFANPSSPHGPGRRARTALDEARAQVARFVGCVPAEVVFCGSATEANHLALRSASSGRPGRNRILLSAIEHPSVLAAAEALGDAGFLVELLPVTSSGVFDLAAMEIALGRDTAAVSLMAAHNETGVIQPVEEAAALARKAGALFHTDAVQTMGKLPSVWGGARPDYLSLAGHKLCGPKGIAVLCVRGGSPVIPLLTGGGQEEGRRSSTEAVPLAVGLGVACRLAQEGLGGYAALALLRDRFEEEVLRPLDATVYGRGAPRLPNTSFFAIPGVDGFALARALDRLGVAFGTGSACHAGSQSLPRVLQCMSAPLPEGASPLRVSLGRTSTAQDMEALTDALTRALEECRGQR